MLKKPKLLNRLTKYFILSTALPFLLLIIISAGLFQGHYTRQLLTLTKGYTESLARNISMFVMDIKQVILLPHFDDNVLSMLSRFSDKEQVTFTDRTEFNNRFGNLISSIRYVSNDFYSTIIVNDSNVIYSSSNYTTVSPIENFDWKSEDWYQKAMDAEGSIIFIPPHIPDYYDTVDDTKKISLACTIRNLVTKKPYAVIKIDILPSSFIRFFSSMNFSVPALVYMTDEESNLIFESATDDFMEDRLEVSVNDNGSEIAEEPDSDLVSHISRGIENTPYTLHILLDRTAITRQTARIYAIGILLYIFAFFIAMFLNRKLTRRISEPINAMRDVLSQVEKGNLDVRYESRQGWELEELGTSLNITINDLHELIEKTYVAELATEKAENKALMSQLQPHFMFNTLNSLIALLYDENYKELENALYSLSDLLRYVLRKDNFVRLEDELSFIKSYLILQKERFGEKLSYEIESDDETLNTIIPRLFLQPFIENAIIHGMEPLQRPCNIAIRSRKEEDKVLISIIDDGAGFDPKSIELSASIGLSNSFERLRIMDPGARIEILSSPDNGCDVEITINFHGEEHESIGS